MARVTYTDWTIPVAQIGSRAGQSMEVDKAFPAPSGIGDTIVGITEGSDVFYPGERTDVDMSNGDFEVKVNGINSSSLQLVSTTEDH